MKAWLLSIVIRLLARTWTIRVHGRLPTGPSIVAFWHGEMLPVWFAFRALRPVALVSSSKDGSLLSRLLQDWGYGVVLGSSSKGGKEALEQRNANVDARVGDGDQARLHQRGIGLTHLNRLPKIPRIN